MFSIGFAEIVLLAVVTLLVVGPERLPETIKSVSLNLAKFRRYWARTKRDLESELGLDDLRREIHNAEVLEHLKETQKMLNNPLEDEASKRAPRTREVTPPITPAARQAAQEESEAVEELSKNSIKPPQPVSSPEDADTGSVEPDEAGDKADKTA